MKHLVSWRVIVIGLIAVSYPVLLLLSGVHVTGLVSYYSQSNVILKDFSLLNVVRNLLGLIAPLVVFVTFSYFMFQRKIPFKSLIQDYIFMRWPPYVMTLFFLFFYGSSEVSWIQTVVALVIFFVQLVILVKYLASRFQANNKSLRFLVSFFVVSGIEAFLSFSFTYLVSNGFL